MEVVISAVLGDVISRSISFFVDRYHRLQTGGAEQSLEQLRSVLLRIQAIVEEAERRNITNQAMLQQLDTLRHGMYRGYYVLDVFTCRGHSDGDAAAKDEVSNHSFVLSRFNPAKRLHLSAQSPQNMVFDGKGLNELRKALCGLEMIVTDMAEFVVFLKSYPPVSRQPCSSYLFSDMYMFGRHTEYERIVSFLLQIGPPGTGNCSVLPIVGPVRIGKTTLVEHVCYDDRVRSYFSSIVFFSGDDLECMTVKANTLFKMVALRSAGPEDYLQLSSIAMEIAAELNSSFSSAYIIGTLLRANPVVWFWRKVLEHIREFTAKHLLMFGEHPISLLQKDQPIYIWRMTGNSEALMVIAHRCYQVCSPQQEVPKLTLHDIVCGRAIPRGKFEFLAWKSHIPPYYSYLMSCSIMTSRRMVVKKKRSRLHSI